MKFHLSFAGKSEGDSGGERSNLIGLEPENIDEGNAAGTDSILISVVTRGGRITVFVVRDRLCRCSLPGFCFIGLALI